MIAEWIVAALLFVGAGFTLVGSVGLVRFPDFYSRLHGATKATTLGVGSLLVASIVHLAAQGEGIHLRNLLVSAFLFMTAPVSAQLLARAGLATRVPDVATPPAEKHGHQSVEGADDEGAATATRPPPPDPAP